jgi:predicted acylesterase/phospholipase RssA
MTGATHDGPAKKTEIGLVLQGGGALGAYEWGGILALFDWMKHAKRRCAVKLQAVTGVSIGAINGACVVGAKSHDDPGATLAALWNDFALAGGFLSGDLALFGVPHFYQFRHDLLMLPNWTFLYDTHALIGTLKKHVDFTALNDSDTVFAVTAVNVKRGELKRFGNRSVGQIEKVELTPEHILASGSLPPQFPWTEIGGGPEPDCYWDGGVIDNTPLGDALGAFTPGDEVTRILVVMNLFPLCAELPKSFVQVNDRINQLRFGNRLLQDVKNADRISELVWTIKDLIPHAPPQAQAAAQKALRRYKHVTTVEVLLSGDDNYAEGDDFRDFSRAGIERRCRRGYEIAQAKLASDLGSLCA